MRPRAPLVLAGVIALGAGCNAPALANFSAGEVPETTGTSGTSGTSHEPLPTTSAGAGPNATTDELGTTSIGGGSTGESAGTTGDPLAPPAIVDHDLAPLPLQLPGPILVAITTAHAHGVRMQVDAGLPVELGPAGADAFHGDIAFYTALDNGDHEAVFVAWRDALESAPLVVPFTVALPEEGSELYWHGDGALGPGVVVALAVTPDDLLLELGTRYPKGQARCYLRRRDLGGAWGPDDVRDVIADTGCTAIDLAVDAAGALHVLAERLLDGELRWWLGRLDAWDAEPVNLATGVPGDVAHALALDPARIAVCGATPKQAGLAAAAWIFHPNQAGKILSFPYSSPKSPMSIFDATARDCVLVGDRLVLAGETRGSHDGDDVARERLSVLELDIAGGDWAWIVSHPGPATQSRAQAIAVDLDGRYIIGGFTCDDACEPRGELRVLLPGGAEIWQKSLPPTIPGPRAIGYSPADYIVYVAARTEGQGATAFFAEAWFPLFGVPLWSYAHMDAPTIHAANALAIGPYGQIYAGGVTAGGYPAVAFIAP